MKIPRFKGIINVITTPFNADNSIDYDVLEKHIEFRDCRRRACDHAGRIDRRILCAVLPGAAARARVRRRQGSRPPADLCRRQLDAGRRDRGAGWSGGGARL